MSDSSNTTQTKSQSTLTASNRIKSIFEAFRAEIHILKECLIVDASDEKQDLPKEQLRDYMIQRGDYISHEIARESLIFGVGGSQLDDESAQRMLDGMIQPVRELVSATQLYLRYFGPTMHEHCTKIVGRIVHGMDDVLRINAERHSHLIDGTIKTQGRGSLLSTKQKRLWGILTDSCAKLKTLPNSDGSAVIRTCMKTIAVLKDSMEELQNGLPSCPDISAARSTAEETTEIDTSNDDTNDTPSNETEDDTYDYDTFDDDTFDDDLLDEPDIVKSDWPAHIVYIVCKSSDVLSTISNVLKSTKIYIQALNKQWLKTFNVLQKNTSTETPTALSNAIQTQFKGDYVWFQKVEKMLTKIEGTVIEFSYASANPENELEMISTYAKPLEQYVDALYDLIRDENVQQSDESVPRRTLNANVPVTDIQTKIEAFHSAIQSLRSCPGLI